MKAPIYDGKIKVADAIDIVAGIVYPDKVKSDKETRRNAKKTVRAQISRAFREGVFGPVSYSNTAQLDEAEFFMWARAQKKWQALLKTKGLPLHFVGQMSAQESDDTMDTSGVTIPPKEKLKEYYIAAQKELWECKQYIEAIKPDLAELEKRRRRDKEISADRSAAGRKGKRSKTK